MYTPANSDVFTCHVRQLMILTVTPTLNPNQSILREMCLSAKTCTSRVWYAYVRAYTCSPIMQIVASF
jgi:hypothetical protein